MLKNIGRKASHFTDGETEAWGGCDQLPRPWLIRTLSHLSGQGSGRQARAWAACRVRCRNTDPFTVVWVEWTLFG